MRASTLRTLLTVLLLALLVAPEALLLHRCACGRVFDCCCRKQIQTAKAGDACPLHAGMSHCAGSSRQTPASLRSGQEPVDRLGTALPARCALRLPPPPPPPPPRPAPPPP